MREVRRMYRKSTVKYSKSTVLYRNFFSALTVVQVVYHFEWCGYKTQNGQSLVLLNHWRHRQRTLRYTYLGTDLK